MQIAEFTDRMEENFRYQIENDNTANVIIYDFIEEVETEEGNKYIYNINEFKVNPNEISENDIKNNLEYYLNYSPKELTADEKIKELEDRVKELEDKLNAQ